jgi:hypothetical protein
MTGDESCQKEKQDRFGLFVPAGLFIGLGIGWAVEHMLPGLFIGLGCGFLVFAIHRARAD